MKSYNLIKSPIVEVIYLTGLSLGMVGLFASFVQFKNRNRFK
jgi:hypothetical protein